jgi:hypothetical protein
MLKSLILMPISEFKMGYFVGSHHLALKSRVHKSVEFLDQLRDSLWDTLCCQIIKFPFPFCLFSFIVSKLAYSCVN